MDLVKRKEMAEKYGQVLDNSVSEEAVEEGIFAFKGYEPGKKFPQLYICEKCGRKKTIRFKVIPTPANAGKCPRCKEGSMYSDFVYKNYKKMVLTKKEN